MASEKGFRFKNMQYCSIHRKYYKEECDSCKKDEARFRRDLSSSTKVMEALRANPAAAGPPPEASPAEGHSAWRDRPLCARCGHLHGPNHGHDESSENCPCPEWLPETAQRLGLMLPRVNRVGKYLIYEVQNREQLYNLLASLPEHFKLHTPFLLGGVLQVITEDVHSSD